MRTSFILAAAMGAVMAAPAWAAGDADAGEALVVRECASCHRSDIAPRPEGAPPSFRDVVRGHKFTRNEMRGFLRQSHYPMPPKALSTSEIEDIVAYFDRQGYWP